MKKLIVIAVGILLFTGGLFLGNTTLGDFKTISNKLLIVFKKGVTSNAVVVDETKTRKDALASFYNELVQAEVNNDSDKSYEFYKSWLGAWITKEEYIAGQKKQWEEKPIVSSDMTIHNITINGDEGVVDRTRVLCYSDKCEDKDKETDHGVRKFVYIDGKWSTRPDREPSERALKVAGFWFTSGSASRIKDGLQRFSYGTDDKKVATHFMALYYDDFPEELALIEANIEKYKAEQSRPIYNYEAPDVTVQAPAVQSAPVNNSLHCSSNKVGNYTYTNCY